MGLQLTIWFNEGVCRLVRVCGRRGHMVPTTATNANLRSRFRSFLKFNVIRSGAIALGMACSVGVANANDLPGGVGGPVEAVAAEGAMIEGSADAQFKSLFKTWQKLDVVEHTVIAIPSMQPVDRVKLTSSFGVRSDPFHGSAAMHAGVDIPGPVGTPVYATADGMIGRSGRFGGYGNLVTVNHGKGIETRYGHLSKILVAPNTRVRRGQLIGLMGSTGRSTGSHLHYEVRVDGAAVNPMPFMQEANVLDQVQGARIQQTAAVGN